MKTVNCVRKWLVLALAMGSLMFAACGDDSASAKDDESSSTEIVGEDSDENSSSSMVESKTSSSSSSKIAQGSSEAEKSESSSSSMVVSGGDADSSSSSEVEGASSSSEESEASSSSKTSKTSSSSEESENSSSSKTSKTSSSSEESEISSSSKTSKTSSSSESGEVPKSSSGGGLSSSYAKVESSSSSETESSSSESVLSSSSEVLESSSSEMVLDIESILEPCSNGETSMYDTIPVTCQNNKWYATGVEFGSLTDERDNQTYKTVKIGQQTWMAENLNYAYTEALYRYEVSMVYEDDSTSWCYKGDPKNCDTYGRLYTWSAAMDSAAKFTVNAGTKCGYGKTCTPNTPHRGICPEGWHVPDTSEFNTLFKTIGNAAVEDSANVGMYLKSTSGWNNDNTEKTDLFGFTVRPAGIRNAQAQYSNIEKYAYFWTATENINDSYFYQFFYWNTFAKLQMRVKNFSHSLRCIKD